MLMIVAQPSQHETKYHQAEMLTYFSLQAGL